MSDRRSGLDRGEQTQSDRKQSESQNVELFVAPVQSVHDPDGEKNERCHGHQQR